MAAVTQNITAEQGAALSVTFAGAGASLEDRELRMHVRSKVGVITTKLVASTGDGRLAVGADPYTTATLTIGSDVMAAVSVTNPIEYWVYDVESYTTAADVRREWAGTFTISRDVTRDTEPDEEDRLAGLVRYDAEQTLSDAEKLQARTNIGASTGTGGGSAAWGGITGTLSAQADLQSALDLKAPLASPTFTGTPAAPQAFAGDSTTRIANTAFVAGEITTHSTSLDPHGDRSFATSAVSAHEGGADPHPGYLQNLSAGTADTIVTASADGTLLSRAAYTIASLISHVVARAQHTGTQLASTISDFATAAVAAVTWSTLTGKPSTFDPSAHKASHAAGGGDALTAADIGAATAAQGTDDRTASGMRTASTVVSVSSATAPSSGQVLTATSSTAATWQTPSGGGGSGGGTKTYDTFEAANNHPPASSFATIDSRNSLYVLRFVDAAVTSAVFVGKIPEGADTSSGLDVIAEIKAATATTGTARIRVEFEKCTTDIDADSFDTATEGNNSVSATCGISTFNTITCTAIDGLVAGDTYRLRVSRVGNDATNDTLADTMQLVSVEVRQVA